MAYLGFSINVVTLLALSLVVGVLVDDASALLLKRQLDRQTGELDIKSRNAKGLLIAVIILSVALITAVAIRLFSR